jgi:cellulose biosynthesis protein BcsQ
MTILTLANSKGGGGKTTIAACLAAELTRRRKQVALLDLYPQQSLSVWHGHDGKLKELELNTDASEKVPCWVGKPAVKASDEIAALATELLPHLGEKGKNK